MFDFDAEDGLSGFANVCSHEDCTYANDEYLPDRTAVMNHEDASQRQAEHGERLEYYSKELQVPVRMRKDSKAVQTHDQEQSEIEARDLFPPAATKTSVTEPLVITPLSSETRVSASAEAIAILEQHNQQQIKEYSGSMSGLATPQMPPPSPEYATLPQTLSTPHLPIFHHYTDDKLLQQYQVERAKDPIAFDNQTANIKHYLIKAKIARGGVAYLKPFEYSVDLASREDACKLQYLGARRKRGITDSDLNSEGALESVRPRSNDHETCANSPSGIASLINGEKQRRAENAESTETLPRNFDFAKHVTKYSTSGAISHQHSRRVVEDGKGTKTILKTRIEITQEIKLTNADQLTWEDVETARENAEAAKTKVMAKNEKQQGDSDAENDDDRGRARGNQKPTSRETDVQELLGAIAKVKGTGKLDRGITLSQYLTEIKRDIRRPNQDTTEAADAGNVSE